MIREVYQEEGVGEKFDMDSVRFLTDRQFAFAAGVSGLILREKTAATFFMGEFYAESLIFAETANSVGAIQVASSTEKTQTPFFIAACDYVLIGDEFYAASAYLTKKPVYVGSLIGQDWCKMAIIFLIFVGTIFTSVQIGPFKALKTTTEVKGTKETAVAEREVAPEDTFFYRLFSPQKNKDWKVEREKYPASELPTKEGWK
jgi:hypothetical protein